MCHICGKELKKNWEFCPFCGNERSELFNDNIFGEIEKQFKVFDKMIGKNEFSIKPVDFGDSFGNQNGISISIDMASGNEPKIKVNRLGEEKTALKKAKSKRKFLDFLKFSKKQVEAKTCMKRLAKGLIYELEVPGLKSIDDVEINQMEDCIEVKAAGKDKIYFKKIPVDFDIKRYYIENDKLVLEFEE